MTLFYQQLGKFPFQDEAADESLLVERARQPDPTDIETCWIVWKLAKLTSRRLKRLRIHVQHLMASACEAATELNLEWMSAVVVDNDSHYGFLVAG